MRKLTYLAVFEPTDDGAYSVYFPSVLGCTSYGDNLYEAQEMAKEALELHIYGMEKDGDILPKENIKDIKTQAGDIVCPITIFPNMVKTEMDSKRVATNCTIPYGLKQKAEMQGINFSQVLEAALLELCK